jgi:serine protease
MTFSDVPADQTFAFEIYALAARGIVGGYDDGTYRPGDPVTRAQFAKIIILALVRQPLDAAPRLPSFVDVPYTGLLYPFAYVETAVDMGIIQGYDDGTFRPGNDMTRAQLALMLVRAGGNRLAQPSADFSDGFTDVPEFAAEAVRIAQYNGLLSGVTPTTFNPNGRATRGQVAKVTYNLIVRLGL